jgi:hypothetical protein
MKNSIIRLSLVAVLALPALAGGEMVATDFANNDDIRAELEALKGEVAALKAEKASAEKNTKKDTDTDALKKLEKKVNRMNKKLSKVKAHDAYDNIKFSMDFRNTYDNIQYKYNDYSYKGEDLSGTEAKNDALMTSRVILDMKAAPTDKLSFQGQLAAYSIWGAHISYEDPTLKSWAGSSKATDTVMRVKRAYFIYSDDMLDGKLPYSFSIGRRAATDGFLANHRENLKDAGSPLAHITNMEVDGIMTKLNTEKFLTTGSFVKFVYGRAHAGGIESVYDANGYEPYAQDDGDVNENVDFLIALGSLYNDGQYNLMFENALVLNTKGAYAAGTAEADELGLLNKSLDAGKANLAALSLQVDGVGDEINDFLDETTLFASIATTTYMPDDGHQLLGSTENKTGDSIWVGATIPDMITDDGRFGIEYNHGSKYWTPMTWSEDSAMGSKVAVRGDAYEAYWNFNLFGEKNLPSQIRYTHEQHDYTPNIRCSGWVAPEAVDIEADDIRVSVSYKY